MKKQNLVHSRTCVYNVNYHIVFSTKYRKKVLQDNVNQFLKEAFVNIARQKGFTLQMVEIGEKDHIHIFISAPPSITPSYIVKMLKGISARQTFVKFLDLRKILRKGHLWNPSYYIETIGSVSDEIIRKYIKNQTC